jgi:ankyrin repeat protein
MLASFFFDERQRGTARAFERHEQIVRLLVGAGAELENDPGRYTPLAYAAYQGNERVVRFLLDRGANVDSSASNGYAYVNTPLMMAAMQGYENIVRTLLRAGANPDVRVRGGHTAAELAFKYNHTSLARLLQQCGLTQRAMNASHCVAALGYDPRERQSALRVD